MDPAAVELLLSQRGSDLLATLPPYEESRALALSQRLRDDGVEPALAAAALTQSRLRARAVTKLGERAASMLFTQAGLEQATRAPVAALHAQRYASAGLHHVADLTAGIGTDALALAAAGLRVTACEIDGATALVAGHNLRDHPRADVVHGDGLDLDLAGRGVDGVYADPARRTRSGARVFDPRSYRPPLDAVWALRDRVPAVGIKVGPGIPHQGLPEDAEVEWVSVDGDVVEAALWFGPLAPRGPALSATVLRHGPEGLRRAHLQGTEPSSTPSTVSGPQDLGPCLFEPDGAVIRAGLVGPLAEEHGARLLDPTIAYLTGDGPAPEVDGVPVASAYRVLDVMPFHLKRLKAYLRERGVGALTVKKRGTAVVPEELRSRLALSGPASATVVLTRVAGSQQVLVVEPVLEPSRSPSPRSPEEVR